MVNNELEIQRGLNTAFVNAYSESNLAYCPEFIANDYLKGKKVLSSLEEELKRCDSFCISVAFITMGGITPLLQTLKELENRGVPGKILTTNFLTFNDPKALEKLANLNNIDLRMYYVQEGEPGFHTKAYMFKEEQIYKMLVGSSNLTLNALTKNKEWNTKIVTTHNGQYAKDILGEFDKMWDQSQPLEDWIDVYRDIYNNKKEIIKQTEIPTMRQICLKPNTMQVAFVDSLKKLVEEGAQRALLISSTGTGKTIASAFALQELMPPKVLFLVHREQILDQTIKSYHDVFGYTKTFGKLCSGAKEVEAQYLFSTMQMMAKSNIREQFKPDEFQVIIIDEVHRAGAESYKTIMDYFVPNLWLGMTASPDRPDGIDIYKMFDNNIAYEIRLQQALEEDLLCPFHYFGITDLIVENTEEVMSEKRVEAEIEELKLFTKLTSDTRVDYVVEKAEYFGHSGDRVKGLVFCSTNNEARILSDKFNTRGYRTISLSGKDTVKEREIQIERLVSDNQQEQLDYIFTVDIFNEGVDIPKVNQIIMLRPTESSIIFIQQLGRGLRKSYNKEYVVVLDFIGNYNNNFMIPIALSGDRSRNKDTLRRYVAEGTRTIPGCSSIHFDEITKERIYRSINKSKLNRVADIKYEYKCLRNKLGRIPTYQDFENYNTIDMQCIFDNKTLGSYHNFLKKYEPEYSYSQSLNVAEEEMLVFVSTNIANGKRLEELLLLKRLLTYRRYMKSDYLRELTIQFGTKISPLQVRNVMKVLTNDFLPSEPMKKKFANSVFVQMNDGEYEVADSFARALENRSFYKLLDELVDYGMLRNKKYYSERYKDTDFVLYQKYTKSEVCRLLNWSKNQNPQNIGGYFYDRETHTLPIYVTYKKDKDVVESQNYEDRFETPTDFISISKSGRRLSSPEVTYFYDRKTKIYLFMQKNSKDVGASEYYFMGEMHIKDERKEVRREQIGDTVLEFKYKMDVPVREDLYQYFSHDAVPVGD